MTKLYAWDFPTFDLAKLSGALVLHGSTEYRCTVLHATSNRVELLCVPLGELTLMRAGHTLVVADRGGPGADKICAITVNP